MYGMVEFIQSLLESNLLLGTLILAVLILILVPIVFSFVASRLKKRTEISAHTFFAKEKWPVAVTGVLTLLLMVYPLSQYAQDELVGRFLNIALIVAAAWFFVREVTFSRFTLEKENNLQSRKVRTQFQYVQTILSIAIVIVALALILRQFDALKGVGTGLLASAGVAGIIVGFAAQKTLANLLAGFQIAFTQPFRVDDAVVVEDEWGWIEEITLTYVVVRIWDKRRLILPITYFVDNPFQNWTRNSADIMGSVYLYVDYTFPVDAVRKELDRLLKKTDLWDGKAKVVQVTNSTERAMELRVLVTASNSPDAWDLRCYVREGLIKFLQKKYPASLPRVRLEADGALQKKSKK